jgi:hypothetical protein
VSAGRGMHARPAWSHRSRRSPAPRRAFQRRGAGFLLERRWAGDMLSRQCVGRMSWALNVSACPHLHPLSFRMIVRRRGRLWGHALTLRLGIGLPGPCRESMSPAAQRRRLGTHACVRPHPLAGIQPPLSPLAPPKTPALPTPCEIISVTSSSALKPPVHSISPRRTGKGAWPATDAAAGGDRAGLGWRGLLRRVRGLPSLGSPPAVGVERG